MFRGLKSLITGIVAGTALGVLFAPEKGHKTRRKIKDEVQGGGSGFSSVKAALNDMGSDIKDSYEEVNKNEKVKQAKKKVKSTARAAKAKGEELYKENVPAKTRKKISRKVKKAKKTASEAAARAKKAALKAQKKVNKKKK